MSVEIWEGVCFLLFDRTCNDPKTSIEPATISSSVQTNRCHATHDGISLSGHGRQALHGRSPCLRIAIADASPLIRLGSSVSSPLVRSPTVKTPWSKCMSHTAGPDSTDRWASSRPTLPKSSPTRCGGVPSAPRRRRGSEARAQASEGPQFRRGPLQRAPLCAAHHARESASASP